MTYSERAYVCPGGHGRRLWSWDTDPLPVCRCGETMALVVDGRTRTAAVIGDDIPGGVVLDHVAYRDGKPQRFFSKEAIREAARSAGWTRYGETPKAKKHREV